MPPETIEALVKVFADGSRIVVLSPDAREPAEYEIEGSSVTVTDKLPNDASPQTRFDIAIVSGDWTEADLIRCFGCRTREAFYRTVRTSLADGGQLLLVTGNPVCPSNRNAGSHFLRCLANRATAGATFLGRYRRELGRAGFDDLATFMVYPDMGDIRQLVSTERGPYLDFMALTYRQTAQIPRDPRRWARWLTIYLGLGRLLFPGHVIQARS